MFCNKIQVSYSNQKHVVSLNELPLAVLLPTRRAQRFRAAPESQLTRFLLRLLVLIKRGDVETDRQRAGQMERKLLSFCCRCSKCKSKHLKHNSCCTHTLSSECMDTQPKRPLLNTHTHTHQPLPPLFPFLSLLSAYSSRSHNVNLKLSQDRRYTRDSTGDDGRSGGVTSSLGSQRRETRVHPLRKPFISTQLKPVTLVSETRTWSDNSQTPWHWKHVSFAIIESNKSYFHWPIPTFDQITATMKASAAFLGSPSDKHSLFKKNLEVILDFERSGKIMFGYCNSIRFLVDQWGSEGLWRLWKRNPSLKFWCVRL